jgi:hypothetical protein
MTTIASVTRPIADEKIGTSGVVENHETIEKPTTTVITDEEEDIILRKIDF